MGPRKNWRSAVMVSAAHEIKITSVVEAVRSVLLGRRTINSFIPDLLADWENSLRRAVKAACYAPNHRRTEPWRFHLLGPKRVRSVCEPNAELVAAKKGDAAG